MNKTTNKIVSNKIISLIWILLFTTFVSAQTKVNDVKTFTLKNGMKCIVLEDHAIPNVASYIFFRVGSRNEHPGITGLSHFLEHMMFNGAKKYGPKMFDTVMEAKGGSNNAYTNENVTVYTNFFPAYALETIFDLEADRIATLSLDEKMVESERGVIYSEYTQGYENNPFELLYDQLLATAFYAHSYRWSVIGYESDILNWKRSDLKNYFDTYYAPNNAVAVFVGDVTVEHVKALAEKYFEPIPSREPPRPVYTKEPPQRGEKRLMVEKDVASPHILIAYHVPESRAKDSVALELLSAILSDGTSSRLHRSLVSDKQLASEINTFVPTALDPTLFSIAAVCAKGIDAAVLEKAIIEEIDRVIRDGVTDQELQKAKNSMLVDFYREQETIKGKANNLGFYEVFFGNFKTMFDIPEDYKKVTKDEIKTVAATYLKKSNRTVGIMKKSEEK
ncbi:MAG: M16 family metallopeptidase [Candidatus Omnitrophota bacterium]